MSHDLILLTPDDAINFIGLFFDKEWRHLKPEDVTVQRIKGGHNNQIYAVSSSKVKDEPAKLAVRRYGSSSGPSFRSYKHVLGSCTETEELVICCLLAEQGLAPKIYGFFDGGRIEEYIDCRLATKDDTSDPSYETDLAKNFARFHAAKLPLPKPKYHYAEKLRTVWETLKTTLEEFKTKPEFADGLDILGHDWGKEVDYMTKLLDPSHHRMVFILWGTHLANVGFLHNPKPGQLKSYLFDYEMCCYNIRGRDLGHYLRHRSSFGPNVEEVFPDVEVCRLFIEEYRKECQTLFADWEPTKKDSFEHIMMEAMIGSMVSNLEMLFWSFNSLSTSKDGMFSVTRIRNQGNAFLAMKERLSEEAKSFQRASDYIL